MPRRQSGHDGSDQASSSWSACVRMVHLQLRTRYCQHQPEGRRHWLPANLPPPGLRLPPPDGMPLPALRLSLQKIRAIMPANRGDERGPPAGRIEAFQNTTGVLPGDRFGPSSCKQRGRARARTFGACRGANDRAALAVARALAAGGLCCPQGPAHHKASVPQPASCLHGQPHTRPR